jgi:DNA-directed RNA polymerase subunit M/transcription elongation factor TFIIS
MCDRYYAPCPECGDKLHRRQTQEGPIAACDMCGYAVKFQVTTSKIKPELDFKRSKSSIFFIYGSKLWCFSMKE